MTHSLPYAANCSLLFTEVPLLERPAAAAAAGFDAIEFWWPWPDQPVPDDREVDGFVTAVRSAGVQLIGLNFFAGELTGPDCGVLSIPARRAEFPDNIDVAVGIGERLGVRAFNALFGNRVDDATPGRAGRAGRRAARGRRPARPSGSAPPCCSSRSAAPSPIPCVRRPTWSRSSTGSAPPARTTWASSATCSTWPTTVTTWTPPSTTYADQIAHVQIADHPGRGEPGTGTLDLDRYLSDLEQSGYSGYVALEYNPTARPPRAWTGCPANAAAPAPRASDPERTGASQ